MKKLKSFFLQNKTNKGASLALLVGILGYLGVDFPKEQIVEVVTQLIIGVGLAHKLYKKYFHSKGE